jgi:hypothetical protein
MLPEGSHLHEEDSTFFILNRQKIPRISYINKTLRIPLIAFTKEESWNVVDETEHFLEVSDKKLFIITGITKSKWSPKINLGMLKLK